MQFDRNKLQALILHVANKCRGDELGAVKLHKVLYYSDMLHYAKVGVPMTGSTYRKRPFGPTCEQLLPALSDMIRSAKIEVVEKEYFGYTKKEYVPLSEVDLAVFSRVELETIDAVIDFVCRRNSARTISEFSHNRAWETVGYGDAIPYSSVLNIFPTEVSDEAFEWAKAEAETGETSRSNRKAMGAVDYRDFRKRVLETRNL